MIYYMKYAFVNGIILDGTETAKKNAAIAEIANETGTIEAGKCADMIVVEEDPLNDLTALRNVSMVIARGRLIRRPRHKRGRRFVNLRSDNADSSGTDLLQAIWSLCCGMPVLCLCMPAQQDSLRLCYKGPAAELAQAGC